MSRSNFQRSQSRVWYGNGNVPDNPFYGGAAAVGMGGGYYFLYNRLQEGRQPSSSLRPSGPSSFQDLDEEEELLEQRTPEKQINDGSANVSGSSSTSDGSVRVGSTVWTEANRQGSPASHKSQDSGFSDTELSPNMPSIGSNTISNSKNFIENQSSPDKLTPKRTINEQLFQRSPSISSEISTPPTVIRRPAPEVTREDITVRRISYSEPNSPTLSPPAPFDEFDSLNFDNTSPLEASQLSIRVNATEEEESSSGPSSLSSSSFHCPTRSSGSSLKRGRVITKCSRVKRNLNHQLRDSEEEMISLDSSELTNILNQTLTQDVTVSNLKTPKSILKTPPSYNNETVLLGYVSPDPNNNHRADRDIPIREKELPSYAELYPNGTSTPIMYPAKFYRSLPPTPTRTQRSPIKFRPTKLIDNFYEEPDIDLSSQRLSQQTDLNFTEYDNPLLNGHTPAVQSWLDGLRFSYQSEVMSILQTKSISVEATRNLKMTSATAVKLIRHLQSKVVTLQGEFEKVEKVFASIKRYQQQQEDEDEDDEKEIYQQAAPLVQSLAANIYQFVQKQKSNDYFGKDPPERADLKKFHENTRSLVDMTTDLRIAAANGEDFDYRSVEEEIQIIKRYFLITIRLIFKNLVKVIVDTIEDSKSDLILRSNLSYVSTLSNLDYQGLASLNDAFISNGTVRALLIVCIECKFSSIRALALRALATVCSTTETIRQLEKADGVEILREILADQKSNERSEPEFREAVSVLTQITAPWHGEDHRIDGLRQHVHAIVEAVTEIVDKTTCCQTLLLCSACLNNLARIEATAVYSLMSHETAGKLKAATQRRGPGASIFLFEQITSMLYNMSSNKKSHHHLAGRPLINFLTGAFNQKFFERMESRVETEAQRKTIKNILHVLSRLVTSGAIGSHDELLATTIVPIFARIERTLDDHNEHFRDISQLNRRLNESLSGCGGVSKAETSPPAMLSILAPSQSATTANPFITRLTIERQPNGGIIMLDNNRQESYV
ncbi:AAEL004719-PA [Aedes aegypti]|uniref:AAEL004719-PA n=1 Tax=Aedes aegypti TaxID=7159 RepID=Q17C23_AEDAE|nr:AAEL004719-PA [Aedes aegypti]